MRAKPMYVKWSLIAFRPLHWLGLGPSYRDLIKAWKEAKAMTGGWIKVCRGGYATHRAMLIRPRPMCPWTFFLGRCVPWMRCPLDDVSQYDSSRTVEAGVREYMMRSLFMVNWAKDTTFMDASSKECIVQGKTFEDNRSWDTLSRHPVRCCNLSYKLMQ